MAERIPPPDWPNRAASRMVEAGGVRFHVQRLGTGPVALLLHGTGASTHSWRGLAALLSPHFDLVMPDLPGQGFSTALATGSRTLTGMAGSIGALCAELGVRPKLAIGHSAGAAVAARMALDGAITPAALIALNGALLPFRGTAGTWFTPIAKGLMKSGMAARIFAWRGQSRATVARLLAGTGSVQSAEDIDLYQRLFTSPEHVGGTLGMMAGWQLEPLLADLPRLAMPLHLVTGSGDTAIAPETSYQVKDKVPGAQVHLIRGLGHLAHEERPDIIAQTIVDIAAGAGIISRQEAAQ